MHFLPVLSEEEKKTHTLDFAQDKKTDILECSDTQAMQSHSKVCFKCNSSDYCAKKCPKNKFPNRHKTYSSPITDRYDKPHRYTQKGPTEDNMSEKTDDLVKTLNELIRNHKNPKQRASQLGSKNHMFISHGLHSHSKSHRPHQSYKQHHGNYFNTNAIGTDDEPTYSSCSDSWEEEEDEYEHNAQVDE